MALLVAFVVAVVLTPVAARVARTLGVVDRPGALKVQEHAVPYLGGLAVLAALVVTLVTHQPRLLLPLVLATALGVTDDVADLSPRLRLGCEVVVGVAGGWAAPATDGWFGVAVTAVAVVGLLNAVNLLDGLDGLAAGVGCASALGFAWICTGSCVPPLALAGALLGFLVWNRPPARIYLGDGGAYLLGTALALLVGLTLHDRHGVATWAAMPLLVLVPVTDTAVAIGRRRIAGRPLFGGDRSHVYDQLVDRGLTRSRAVLTMIVAQAVLAALGVAVAHLPAPAALGVATLVVLAVAALMVVGRFLTADKGAP